MDRSSDFHDSDVLRLMTAALDSVVGACAHAQTDIEKLRLTAARHILECVGADKHDGDRLACATLPYVRLQDFRGECASTITQWPWAHRNSA